MASAEARIRAWPLPPWYVAQQDAKTARLISLPDFLGGELHHLGLILWLATIFFLVLTIVAAMSIFQIELDARRQEFAIRSMLGASPHRLYASFSLGIGFVLLSALIASFLVRYALIRATASYLSLPRGLPATAGGIAVAMAVGAVGIVFIATVMGQGRGLVPNPRPLSSISSVWGSKPIKRAIKPHTVSGPSFPVQITLAAVVLITAALLARSAYNLMRIDPGLQPQNAFVCEIALPSSFGKSILKPPDPKLPPEERKKAIQAIFKRFHQLLNTHFTLILQRLGTNPGLASDGLISVAPYRGYPGIDMDSYYSRTPWLPQPGQPPLANIIHHTLARTMSPGAIPALGMRLISGNNFSMEGADQPTVIVNQALAEDLGPGSSALGQYIQIYGFQIQGFPPARIIGIVSNVHETALYSPPQPTVYYPLNEWAQTNVDMVVRTSPNISGQEILGLIQASVQAIAPDATVSNFASLSERVQSAGKLTRYCAYYLLALAGLSVFLAGICAWARSICEIHRRKQEIGIRMALGGTPGNIVQLVLIRGLKLAALAALAGVLVARWFSHLLSHLFYGVKLSDPFSYLIGITTIMGFVFIVQTWSITNAVQRNPSDLMRAGLETGSSSPIS
jgi:ABC-type antimicrobial peptide transport system permease subunit